MEYLGHKYWCRDQDKSKMSSDEEDGGERPFGFDGFPSFDVRDIQLTSTQAENTRLRRELERISRQMERLMTLDERERSRERTPMVQRQMKPVPIFSGKDSKISVNDWIREVDYTVRTAHLDDHEALDLLERYVAGQAAKVFRGEVNKGRRYPEVLKRMQVMFGGIEYRGRDPLQIFYCRSQKENESPAEFAIELADLLGIAEKEGNNGNRYPNRDKMLTDAFMGGLRDEKTIMQLRPLVAMDVSFERIQDELLKFEYDKKRVKTAEVRGEPGNAQNPLLKAIKEIKTELKEELKKMDNKIEQQGKEIRELRQKVEKDKGKSQSVVCYKCGETGHLSYNCQSESPTPQPQCNKGYQPRSQTQTQRNVNKMRESSGEENPVSTTQREQSNYRSLQGQGNL